MGRDDPGVMPPAWGNLRCGGALCADAQQLTTGASLDFLLFTFSCARPLAFPSALRASFSLHHLFAPPLCNFMSKRTSLPIFYSRSLPSVKFTFSISEHAEGIVLERPLVKSLLFVPFFLQPFILGQSSGLLWELLIIILGQVTSCRQQTFVATKRAAAQL